MYTLYYYPLCPLSQKVHWMLHFFKVQFVPIQIINKHDYNNIHALLNFSPLPLLQINENNYLTESLIISNYLNYNYGNKQICFDTQAIETITDIHFYRDIYMNIVYERTLKTLFATQQPPNINKIKEGLEYLKKYLKFFEALLSCHHWVNKFQFSTADISLFTQLMCLDYCGQVPWLTIPEIKKWYMRLKCRPEAQIILKEHIGIFSPPSHYRDLDF